MSIFYTLDRCNSLSSGMKLDLVEPYCPIDTLQEHALSRFDNGVSLHANNQFFNYNINLAHSDDRYGATIELLLEERRKSDFPQKPSRFQSLFACTSVKGATWFRGFAHASIETPIFEVHTYGDWHIGDMNLLNMNCTPVELSRRLDMYWQGITYDTLEGHTPFWEVLARLPVRVGEKVQE